MFILKVKSNIYIFTALFAVVFVCLFFFTANSARAVTATGTFTSQIKVEDTGTGVNWKTISWTASTTASSSITMKTRTATTSDMSSATDWASCNTVSNGADISANNCVTDGQRYIQYRAWLETEYATATEFVSPELLDVTISYDAAGILISSPYNTMVNDTIINEARWTETKPGGSDVLIQLRSSPDNSSWTGWLGPDGTSEDYFTDPSGNESIPVALRDGANDQWLQYRVILNSGGSDIPVLSDITIDYQATVPVITSVSPGYAESNASGTVAMTINGSNFVNGAIVKMIRSGVEIDATDVIVVSSGQITCNFDISRYGGATTITVTNPNNGYGAWNNFYVNKFIGTFISRAKELPINLYFNAINWTATTTATSTITMKARTDIKSDMSGATDWASCGTVSNGADISANNCVTDGERYIQYRAELAAVYGTSTGYFTPELGEVSIGYDRYAATGTLVSSPYNSANGANALSKIFWTETAPAGTDIKFQIRTAADNAGSPGSWSQWCGAHEAGDYYYNPGGQGGIYLGHTDGANDQWFQYRAWLESDGADTPVLSDVTIEYGAKQYSTIIIKDGAIFKDGTIFR